MVPRRRPRRLASHGGGGLGWREAGPGGPARTRGSAPPSARGRRMTPVPRSDLDRRWAVEASAGPGKTAALVDRMVEVIAAGTPVETIVAVTFTHAAAGNMKLRVRHELERRRAREVDADVSRRLAEAARSVDRAFIGTIHAFCAQLLRRRPVEARIDPDFQELAQPDALRVFA